MSDIVLIVIGLMLVAACLLIAAYVVVTSEKRAPRVSPRDKPQPPQVWTVDTLPAEAAAVVQAAREEMRDRVLAGATPVRVEAPKKRPPRVDARKASVSAQIAAAGIAPTTYYRRRRKGMSHADALKRIK